MTRFVAVDGEGETLPDGRHIYTMMADSTGRHVRDPDGLDFPTCARFLLDVKRRNPDAQIVAYGFGYDSNMILESLGIETVGAIMDAERRSVVMVGNTPMGVKWTPRRELWLKPYVSSWEGSGVQVWDTLGFFQSSFVEALEAAGWTEPETLATIRHMKAARSSFRDTDPAAVLAYCIEECRLLVRLMDELATAIHGLGWSLSRWDGAGAVASAMLTAYGVKAHSFAPEVTLPEGFAPAVLGAYYGGRFETFKLGEIGPVYGYDLRSAYPAAIRHLPCLANAQIRLVSREEGLGVYRVAWTHPMRSRREMGPFAWRSPQGRILYPLSGEGWVWSPELAAARDLGIPYRVIEGWAIDPAPCDGCGGKPFAFIESAYEARAAYKRAGDSRQKPLKLAINAVYGKLAQGVGSASYQNYVWAGLITSTTRADILRVAYPAQESLVYIATDGVAFDQPQPIPDVGGLGSWESGHADHCFSVANGQRLYRIGDNWQSKTRGYGRAESIPWDLLRERWARQGLGASVDVEVTRFVGAALARHHNAPESWCRWPTQSRALTCAAGWSRLPLGTTPPVVATEAWATVNGVSSPYVPKRNRLEEMGPEQLARELDLEWMYAD